MLITRCEAENLNSKAEFRQPPIVQVLKELRAGPEAYKLRLNSHYEIK